MELAVPERRGGQRVSWVVDIAARDRALRCRPLRYFRVACHGPHPAGRAVRRRTLGRPPPRSDCGRGGASSESAAPPTSTRARATQSRFQDGPHNSVRSCSIIASRTCCGAQLEIRTFNAAGAPSRPAAALRVGDAGTSWHASMAVAWFRHPLRITRRVKKPPLHQKINRSWDNPLFVRVTQLRPEPPRSARRGTGTRPNDSHGVVPASARLTMVRYRNTWARREEGVVMMELWRTVGLGVVAIGVLLAGAPLADACTFAPFCSAHAEPECR